MPAADCRYAALLSRCSLLAYSVLGLESRTASSFRGAGLEGLRMSGARRPLLRSGEVLRELDKMLTWPKFMSSFVFLSLFFSVNKR